MTEKASLPILKFKVQTSNKILGLDWNTVRPFMGSLVVVILFVSSLIIILIPRFGKLSEVIGETGSLNQKTKDTNEKYNYLRAVDVEDLRKNADLIGKALPVDKNLYFLIKVMQKVGEENGFLLDQFSFSPGEVKDIGPGKSGVTNSISQVPISVVVVGERDKYVQYLQAIERALPLMSIGSFQITGTGLIANIKMTVVINFSSLAKLPETSKISLADLKLSDPEKQLLGQLKDYKSVDLSTSGDGTTQAFVDYQREDPFR